MKSIGENIRYYRVLNGWSQEEMADKLNVSLPTYSRIERNIIDISYKRLLQIAKTCGISIAQLVDAPQQPKKLPAQKSYQTKKQLANQLHEPVAPYETTTIEQKYMSLLEDYNKLLKEYNKLLAKK